MAENRRFSGTFSAILNTQYRNIESLTNPTGLVDNLNLDFSRELADGSGLDRADLQWHDQRQLINATEVLALDGALTNKWGDSLDFDAIKGIFIQNREQGSEPAGGDDETSYRILEVHFKNESYYIGPNGIRWILEPGPGGILSIASSGSEIEGSITISSNADVTYDIVLIGSRNESSIA